MRKVPGSALRKKVIASCYVFEQLWQFIIREGSETPVLELESGRILAKDRAQVERGREGRFMRLRG